MSIIADFLTEHRSWFVVIVVLPLSLIFDILMHIRAWVIAHFFSAKHLHESRVKKIQQAVRDHYEKNDGTKLCTARYGWQSISPGFRK